MGYSQSLYSGLACTLCFAASQFCLAADPQNVREYQQNGVQVREWTENGVTLRETRQVLKRPVWETKYEDQPVTAYREELKTEYQTVMRQYQVPITEWVPEQYMVNRWNPFATPYMQQRYVPRTRYEWRQEPQQIPITRRNWVPQQQTQKVAKWVQREVEEEVIRRVAIRDVPPGLNTPANTALVATPNAVAPSPTTSGGSEPFAAPSAATPSAPVSGQNYASSAFSPNSPATANLAQRSPSGATPPSSPAAPPTVTASTPVSAPAMPPTNSGTSLYTLPGLTPQPSPQPTSPSAAPPGSTNGTWPANRNGATLQPVVR
ncbi:MAG: hypothetical protein SFX18_19480 [Pirellulales bacterium]|nr:hypothetical protein [Pirellulales bacterium]